MKTKDSQLAGLNRYLGTAYDELRSVTTEYADIRFSKQRTERRIELLSQLIGIEEEEGATLE